MLTRIRNSFTLLATCSVAVAFCVYCYRDCAFSGKRMGGQVEEISKISHPRPQRTSSEPADYVEISDREHWSEVSLIMYKDDGSECRISLLRPESWLDLTDCRVGNQIFLELDELGLRGYARVESVGPCPKLDTPKDGTSTVIGTFVTDNAKVLDLYLVGSDNPIGTTASHPFWSISRNKWIDAAELRPNELLKTRSGTAKVDQVVPRPGRHTVYNIQVHRTRTYFVSEIGILVHNSYVSRPFPVSSRAYRVPRTTQEKWIREGALELADHYGTDLAGLKIAREVMEGQIIHAGGNPKLFQKLLDQVFAK